MFSPPRLTIVHNAIYSRLSERKQDLLFEGSEDLGDRSGPDALREGQEAIV